MQKLEIFDFFVCATPLSSDVIQKMKIIGIIFIVLGFVNSIYHGIRYSSLIDELNSLLEQKGKTTDPDLITNFKTAKAFNLAGQYSPELKQKLKKSLIGIYSTFLIWLVAIVFLGV